MYPRGQPVAARREWLAGIHRTQEEFFLVRWVSTVAMHALPEYGCYTLAHALLPVPGSQDTQPLRPPFPLGLPLPSSAVAFSLWRQLPVASCTTRTRPRTVPGPRHPDLLLPPCLLASGPINTLYPCRVQNLLHPPIRFLSIFASLTRPHGTSLMASLVSNLTLFHTRHLTHPPLFSFSFTHTYT